MSQSQALQKQPTDTELLKKILFKGDLSDLTPEQQIAYYIQRCERIGLDPYSKPFDFLEIADKKTGEKKIVLYANKECAAQLTVGRNISIEKLERTEENGVYTVVAHVRTGDGRTGINLSVAKIKGLDISYENAVKRCVTQAIRRAILMVCGLGDTDESEIDSIPNAKRLSNPEQDAVMTDQEQEQLTLTHKALGLDQWTCGRGLAMKLITVCKLLEAEGADSGIWHAWLPTGIESRKDLTEEQAQETLDWFTYRLGIIRQAEITKWNCSPHWAIKLMGVYGELITKGIDKETIQKRLPNGIPSFRALSDAQAEEALKAFQHWLKTYQEVVNNV